MRPIRAKVVNEILRRLPVTQLPEKGRDPARLYLREGSSIFSPESRERQDRSVLFSHVADEVLRDFGPEVDFEENRGLQYALLVLFRLWMENPRLTQREIRSIQSQVRAAEKKWLSSSGDVELSARTVGVGYESEVVEQISEFVVDACRVYQSWARSNNIRQEVISKINDSLDNKSTIPHDVLNSVTENITHDGLRIQTQKALQILCYVFGLLPAPINLLSEAKLWLQNRNNLFAWQKRFAFPEYKMGLDSELLLSSTFECRSRPHISVRAKLREMLQQSTVLSCDPENSINYHTTYSGIRVSCEDSEFMDVLLVSAAAGFLPQAIFDQVGGETIGTERDLEQEITFSQKSIQENYPKASTSIHGTVYFPFHRVRKAYEIATRMSGNIPSENYAVERRGAFSYPHSEITDFVKETLFADAAARCVAACQLPEESCTPNDLLARKAWKKLMKFWKGFSFYSGKQVRQTSGILQEYGITPLLDFKDYWIDDEEDPVVFEEKYASNPYVQTLQDVLVLSYSADSPEFRLRVRRACYDLISEVRKIYELR